VVNLGYLGGVFGAPRLLFEIVIRFSDLEIIDLGVPACGIIILEYY